MTDAPGSHDPFEQPQQYGRYEQRGARRARRRGVAGPILAAMLVLGLVAGGGWYLTDGMDTVPTGQDEPLTVATDDVSTPPVELSVDTPTPSATPSRTPSKKPTVTPTPTRTSTAPSRRATRTPSPTPTRSSPKPSPTRTPTSTPSTTTPPPPSTGTKEAQVLQLTNNERQKAGCGPLRTNSALTRAADGHAIDMVRNHYFDHTSQDGRSPFDRMKAAGFTGGAMAENIAVGYSSAADVVEGWMNSEGHRRNILNCDYTMIGIGYDSGRVKPEWGNGSWVQNFGG
ncbi:CAP domain-containing protein [Kribbella caucasensis]|uniref:CAP domain-containing protein n=1 Tax=Kribbella caucasensis TaxID=2512215 RepID=UPI001060C3CF|nr:CAP domain-containing protein [Kribbella sp. VKM Ac-2527]